MPCFSWSDHCFFCPCCCRTNARRMGWKSRMPPTWLRSDRGAEPMLKPACPRVRTSIRQYPSNSPTGGACWNIAACWPTCMAKPMPRLAGLHSSIILKRSANSARTCRHMKRSSENGSHDAQQNEKPALRALLILVIALRYWFATARVISFTLDSFSIVSSFDMRLSAPFSDALGPSRIVPQ